MRRLRASGRSGSPRSRADAPCASAARYGAAGRSCTDGTDTAIGEGVSVPSPSLADPAAGRSRWQRLIDVRSEVLAAGASLAICTNKPERLTHLLIDALGWRGRFGAIVGADTLAVRKPDPAPAREAIARAGGGRAVFIGDSITDAETARAAELPFVAVSFGFADRPAEALGADAVIDRYAALAETLAAL